MLREREPRLNSILQMIILHNKLSKVSWVKLEVTKLLVIQMVSLKIINFLILMWKKERTDLSLVLFVLRPLFGGLITNSDSFC